jgi:Zn-dependent metalloprotease
MTLLQRLLIAAGLAGGLLAAQAAPLDGHPAVQRALAHIKAHQALLNAGADDAFTATDVIVDRDGAEHVRFHRTFKGLPVIGGDFVLHTDSRGAFRAASQTLHAALRNVGTDPSVAAETAHAAALQVAREHFDGQLDAAPRSRLVVWARGETPHLAHDVTLEGFKHEGSPSVLHVILDAHTGALIDQYDEIETGTATGTGQTLLSGTVSITTNSTSGGYEMRDPLRSNNYTVNMKNRRFGKGAIFTDADDVWGDFTNSDPASVGADAHYGMEVTWDYYKNVHGRNGIDGKGKTAYSRVHYSKNYVNAYWSDSCFCMTYGDGDGRTYLPLVALDVSGHEMSHGVTSNSAGLVYSGESGGLNEGNSDIFGTMVEFYVNNPKQKPNYLIGERIYAANQGKDTPTTALRYMFKPSLDGKSPDCYNSNIGSLDVHYSSGIANHFFYLFAEGATVPAGFSNLTPNDLVCNGNTALTGVGRDAAQKIWYRALTVYMTSNTNYAAARQAVLSAAADLYGNGSPQYNTAAQAWSAVSVN